MYTVRTQREIGTALRELRNRNGHSYVELAEQLARRDGRAVSKSMVISWESGKVELAVYYAAQICNIYKERINIFL